MQLLDLWITKKNDINPNSYAKHLKINDILFGYVFKCLPFGSKIQNHSE